MSTLAGSAPTTPPADEAAPPRTLAQGWVIRSQDLDPWVSADVRAGARTQALAFHDFSPGFSEVLAWQRGLEASADRTGLLFSGSVGAALDGLRLAESPFWPAVDDQGLGAFASRVEEDLVAYRVQELLRFALDPELEDLERELFS